MNAATKVPLDRTPVHLLSPMVFLAGAAGMVLSFVFLGASDPRDVVAGGSGFIAGAVLAAGGLVSMALLIRPAAGLPRSQAVAWRASAVDLPMDVERWLDHFRRNRENRPEPEWTAPITLAANTVAPLLRSLQQFQLGDGGGPACLIAWNADRFRNSAPGIRELVDLWFAEEREHSRLLGGAVSRFGGECIRGHWSFTAFCLTRKWLGVRFELTVLLLTEIVSTVYYRLLRRHARDPALRGVCRLILRDESGHVAFHRSRLARAIRHGRLDGGRWWEARMRLLGLGAATMLWINHAPGLRAVGATGREYYSEIWAELSRFVRRLRSDVAGPPRTV